MTDIHIDIDGVEPTTRLGDLTVSQFIQLAAQLREELGGSAWREHRQKTARPSVERLLRLLKSDDENVQTVKRAFRDLGATLPTFLMEIIAAVEEPKP